MEDKEIIKEYERIINTLIDDISIVCKSYEYVDVDEFECRRQEIIDDYNAIRSLKKGGDEEDEELSF